MNQTNTLLLSAIEERLFPGCAAILFNGKDEEASVEGSLHFDTDVPVNQATLYDVASLTKVITFIGDLQLVAKKVLNLDESIAEWLPFKQKGSIQDMTLRHLLTCGVDFVLPPELEKQGIHLTDPSGHLRFFNEATLRAEPGTTFLYSNLPAFIGGMLLEKILGKNLEIALREQVLEPLKMDDTCFTVRPHRLARTAPTQIAGTTKWQTGIVQDPMSRKFLPRHVGIAGLFSSIRDMAKLVKFLGSGLTPSGSALIPMGLWRKMIEDQLVGRAGAHEPRKRDGVAVTDDGDRVGCRDVLVFHL